MPESCTPMVIIQRRGAGGISPEKKIGSVLDGYLSDQKPANTFFLFFGVSKIGRKNHPEDRSNTQSPCWSCVSNLFGDPITNDICVWLSPLTLRTKSRSENRTKQNPSTFSSFSPEKPAQLSNRSGGPLGPSWPSDRNFFEGMVERKLKRAFKITDHMEPLGCYGGPKRGPNVRLMGFRPIFVRSETW